MNAFIPHKLENILHFERDDELEKQGIEINNPFQKIVGKIVEYDDSEEESINDDTHLDNKLAFLSIEDESKSKILSSEDESASIPSSNMSDHDAMKNFHNKPIDKQQRTRDESLSTKKARKKAIKEENRERRCHKIPKKIKRQKEKQSKKH